MFVGLLGMYSCKERVPYVLAELVEIEYYDTIRVDDWIKIDEILFDHIEEYQVIKDDSLRTNEVYEKNLLPTTIEGVTVPGAGEKEFAQINVKFDLAYALFTNLAQKDQDGVPMYSFEGATLELSMGKMKFRRTDGEKIKVSTSKGYGAAVRKLK